MDKPKRNVINSNIYENTESFKALHNNDVLLNENQQLDMECEKQKQLSDWYYIKTSPKPKQISPRKIEKTEKKILNLEKYHLENQIELCDKNNFQFKNKFDSGIIKEENIKNKNLIKVKEELLSRISTEKSSKFNQKIKTNSINSQPCQNVLNHLSEKSSPISRRHGKQKSHIESRLGEISSSSFEHVNVSGFIPNVVFPDKLLNSSGNISAIDRTVKQEQLKYHVAKTRPLPVVPNDEMVSFFFFCMFLNLIFNFRHLKGLLL